MSGVSWSIMWNVALILAASLLSQTVDGTSAILDALDKAAVETNRFSAHFSVAKVDPLTEETERRSGEAGRTKISRDGDSTVHRWHRTR